MSLKKTIEGKMMKNRYKFSRPLSEGLIKSRLNRFVMNVKMNDSLLRCHCPSTGRIGCIKFTDVPCLLSDHENAKRKTSCTVEAISLDRKNWIGINQTKANSYIEFFLRTGQLRKMVGDVKTIRREVKLNKSRIDFLINGSCLLEVKTPLTDIGCGGEKPKKFISFERTIRHMNDISGNRGKRAIFLLCFLFNAKKFRVPKPAVQEARIVNAARRAASKGLETWQINLKIDRKGVSLIKYFKLDLF